MRELPRPFRFYLYVDDVKKEVNKEPIGWDGFETTLKRDETYHGITVGSTDITVRFYDIPSMNLIKSVYDDDITRMVYFTMEYNGEEQFRGVLDFASYNEVFEKYRYISIKISNIGVETTFENRKEQKVDLDSLTAFDGATLPAYPFLSKSITLPGKDMLLRSTVNNDNYSNNYSFEHPALNPDQVMYLQVNTQNIVLNDLEAIYSVYGGLTMSPTAARGNVFFRSFQTETLTTSVIDFAIRYNFILTGGTDTYFNKVEFIVERNGEAIDDFPVTVYEGASTNRVTIDVNESELKIEEVKDQDELTCYFRIYLSGTSAGQKSFFIFSQQSSIGMSALSNSPETTAVTSFVHEALSRIAESTTNGEVTVKSDYYGRTDSDVNPTEVNGEGSERIILTGLRVRKATQNGSRTLFSLSFSDALKGLHPIDNIGYGFVWENGVRYLRIEPYEWFYPDRVTAKSVPLVTVIKQTTGLPGGNRITISDLKEKGTSVNTNLIIATFKTGYKKYETEGVNGLDAFITDREYRTRQSMTETKLEKVSEFVADTYAIEATRRYAHDPTTKDWRYDNDVFIIQLKKEEEGYVVEQGVVESSGVISPTNLYNVRLSPARCAKRWLNRIFGWSRKPEQLIFTGGKGNIVAITKVTGEDELTEENGNIASVNAVLKAETMQFEQYLKLREYKDIIQNPYGQIIVDGQPYYLLEMKYRWRTGLASFKVIPKWNG